MADAQAGATVVQHNPGGVDQFGYSIAFQKIGSGKIYSVPNFVPELNVYESLNAKSLSLTMTLLDGAGLVKAISLQPGDGIQVTLFKDPNGLKIVIDDFIIQDINSGTKITSGQGQSYIINAIQKAAYQNMVSCVNKAYTGTLDAVLKQLVTDALNTTLTDAEATTGSQTVIFPGCRAFTAIDWVMKNGLSASGRPDSLYYFWAGADAKLHFKTYRSVVAAAQTHPYTVGVDQTRNGTSSDIFRIDNYQRNSSGNHTDRLHSGLLENELMQFNLKNQTFTTKKFQYSSSYQDIHVLSPNPIGDIDQNITAFQSQAANSQYMGLSAHVHVRSDESAYGQFNGTEQKFGHTVAQTRLINQISYSVTMRGDPTLRAGDILNVTAPELSAVDGGKSFDPLFNGKFMIVNVRHQITDGNAYRTMCDVFRDGPDTAVFSNPNGA